MQINKSVGETERRNFSLLRGVFTIQTAVFEHGEDYPTTQRLIGNFPRIAKVEHIRLSPPSFDEELRSTLKSVGKLRAIKL